MLQREIVRFRASDTQPNPLEVDYWIDVTSNYYGGCIRYYRNDTNTWEMLDLNDKQVDAIIDYINNELKSYIDGKIDDVIDNFYEYLKRHIDNDTIYADDERRVIKSKGGSGPSTKTFDITVTLSDAEKGSVSITGTEVLKQVATEGKYVYTVGAVSDATIKATPTTGYLIQKLIVDGEDKGALNSYTFESINANHSIRVELAQDERYTIPPKWRRSDNQQEYLGIYNATRAVVEDYPDGLTQDVTLTCLEDVVDYQNNTSQIATSMWNVDIKNWNKDTQYILTIDGDGKCVMDGRGFGGIHIENCSNFIIKGITFQNFNTYEGVYTPEEPACIYVTNTDKKDYRNVYIENITINGQSTKTPASGFRTRYGITVKGVSNVTIYNITMRQVVVRPIAVSDADIIDIHGIRFYKSDMQSEVIGHPSIMELSGEEMHISDCIIDGSSYNEACIQAGGVKRIYIQRNHIYNCAGPVCYMSNELGTETVDISNNYLNNNATLPKYQWDCTWFGFSKNVGLLQISNNTIVFNSTYYQEFFARTQNTNIDKFVNVNNIYARTNSNNHGLYLISSLKQLISGNNIYYNEGTYYSMSDRESPIILTGKLDNIQKSGYETGSVLIQDGVQVLMNDRPSLLPEYAEQYKCIAEYVKEFDYKYQTNNPQNTSLGCDNYFSTPFDETSDDTEGYDGINYYDKQSFDSEAQYSAPAEQILLLKARSKNRSKFIKYTITKSDDPDYKIVSIGRMSIVTLLPKLDINEEYLDDQLYDVNM